MECQIRVAVVPLFLFYENRVRFRAPKAYGKGKY